MSSLCLYSYHLQQRNRRAAEPRGKVITFRKTPSEMLYFRTHTLHYLRPSLQTWYNAWQNSKSFWKSEHNCELKLILDHISKEMVTYSDISNVYHLLANIHNFLFSSRLRRIQLCTGFPFVNISLSLLFVKCFSRESTRTRFAYNKFRGKSGGCVASDKEGSWMETAISFPWTGWRGGRGRALSLVPGVCHIALPCTSVSCLTGA